MFEMIDKLISTIPQASTNVQGSMTKSTSKLSLEEGLIKNGICGIYKAIISNCSTSIRMVYQLFF